jgi:hypothetical protein
MNFNDTAGVVALLDQLKYSPAWQELSNNQVSVASLLSQLGDSEDISKFTFQQALPIVSQLADDPAFIAALTKVRELPCNTCNLFLHDGI